MLLALGPLQLDTTARTVVVGLVASADPACVEQASVGADALWFQRASTAQVADAGRRSGLPVGVTVEHLDLLAELAGAGAVAVELASADLDVAHAARLDDLGLWCTPAQARRALEVGVSPDRVVTEGGGAGVPGATVPGDGPATWGAVLRTVEGGARVVRTTDVAAVRRVVTVVDRLAAARREREQVGS